MATKKKVPMITPRSRAASAKPPAATKLQGPVNLQDLRALRSEVRHQAEKDKYAQPAFTDAEKKATIAKQKADVKAAAAAQTAYLTELKKSDLVDISMAFYGHNHYYYSRRTSVSPAYTAYRNEMERINKRFPANNINNAMRERMNERAAKYQAFLTKLDNLFLDALARESVDMRSLIAELRTLQG